MIDDLFNDLDPNAVDTFLTDEGDTGVASSQSSDTLANLQSTAPLSLGTLDFNDWSTPTSVKYGKKQRHKVHELPGGDRFVDVLGSTYNDITWNGIFLGSDRADMRAQLDAMVDDGESVTLAWGGVNLDVIPVDCDYSDHDGYTDYTVTCVVLSVSATTADSPTDYSMVSDDVDMASQVAPASSGIGDLTSLTSLLRTISTSPSSLSNPTVTGLLASASATMTQETANAAQTIRLAPLVTDVSRSTADAISDITSTANALQVLTTSGIAAAYLNRSLNLVTSTN